MGKPAETLVSEAHKSVLALIRSEKSIERAESYLSYAESEMRILCREPMKQAIKAFKKQVGNVTFINPSPKKFKLFFDFKNKTVGVNLKLGFKCIQEDNDFRVSDRRLKEKWAAVFKKIVEKILTEAGIPLRFDTFMMHSSTK